jgi:hypothetical protein
VAGGYFGAIAFASIALALRGRVGAGSVFPLRACFYAPLWVVERSVSVYWALGLRMRGAAAEPAGLLLAEKSSPRAASGGK